MKKRTIILIALILLLPLIALTWAMVRLAKNEQMLVRQRFSDVLEGRLEDVNSSIVSFYESLEPDLNRITSIDDFDIETLRKVNRSEPRLFQLFVLDQGGELLYPNPSQAEGPLSGTERKFLTEAARMFTGQDLEGAVANSESTMATNRGGKKFQQPGDSENDLRKGSKWFVWYWERGLNLIYWQRRPSGKIVGCALDRSRWIADLIADLPDTEPGAAKDYSAKSSRGFDSRIRLVNAAGVTVYQWGRFRPAESAAPVCEIPVAEPLASWRLQCFVPDNQLVANGSSSWFGLATMLAAVSLVIAVGGYLLVREYARDMRSAEQQVSFVNQVSHELKTPLTNIRMYAELLERDFDQMETKVEDGLRGRLDVILSESQRLSRLIGNVLTFARHQRDTLSLRPVDTVPGQVVEQIVDRFRPALEEKGIAIEIDNDGEKELSIDTDILEQIVGNLISNVEKYAAEGGRISIKSRVAGNRLSVDIRDVGPGIEPSKRGLVFEPFRRACNDVSSAAGTGIGLSIARELARLHGGDLVLKESDQGCWFQATLKSKEP